MRYFKKLEGERIFIGDENYRSKGYGTEAIQLILDFGLNYLNLNNINLDLMNEH